MRYIFVLIIIGILSGCASTAPQAVVFDNSRTYNKSQDQIWRQLEAYFNTSGIPVKTRDKQKGILLARRHLLRGSIYADCGQSDIASVGDGVLTVKVSLQSLGRQETRATIDVTFSAFRQYGSIAKTRIECFSNGTLEKEIFDSL